MTPAPAKIWDVFLSHSSQDKPAVREIAKRLQGAHISPWFDEWELVPGAPWQEPIESALAHSACCAVFFGPAVDAHWRDGEMRVAVQKRIESNSEYRVIPVLLPGADPSTVPDFVKLTTWIDFRNGLNDENALQRFVAGIANKTAGPQSQFDNPYPGLNSFDVGSRFFFGREELTKQALEKLAQVAQSNSRFLAVAGCSGSGKSSLTRAGMLTALKTGNAAGFTGSQSWPQIICRPGSNPIENLALAMSKLPGAGDSAKAVADSIDFLRTKMDALHLTVRRALRDEDSSRRAIVFVDQFEECFTTCQNNEVREAFLQVLLEAAEKSDGQVIVLIAMRIDFMGECAAVPRLRASIQDRTILVGEIEEKELRAAIETPARINGREFEPGLVDVLLEEVRGRAGSLPLLQFTLQQLWIESTGRYLSHEAYRKSGGVGSALGNKADEVYARLGESERELCRRVFLRLVQDVGNGRYTRRRALLSELIIGKSSAEVIHSLLTTLSAEKAWLVTMQVTGTDTFVEIAHEALIRGWKTLSAWLAGDQEFQHRRIQLQNALELWKERDRDPGSLIRGKLLDDAEIWISKRADEFNAQELEFIQLSKKRVDGDIRYTRVLRAVAGVVVIILVGLAVSVYDSDRQAQSRKFAAAVSRINNPLKQPAVWLALHAVSASPTREAYEALGKMVQATGGEAFVGACPQSQPCAINAIVFNPRNDSALSAGEDLNLRLLDTKSLYQQRSFATGAVVRSLAFDSTGERLATAGAGGVQTFGFDSGIGKPTTISLKAAVAVRYLGSDGTKLAAALEDGSVYRFNSAGEGQQGELLFSTRSSIRNLAVTPDGRWIAVADGERATLWSAGNPSQPSVLTGGKNSRNQIVDLAFNSDGTRLATASTSGWLGIWKVATGEPIYERLAGSQAMTTIAYNRNGWLATGSQDQTIRLWDQSAVEQFIYFGFTSPVSSIAFSPDGKHLVAGAVDNTMRIFPTDYKEFVQEGLVLVSCLEPPSPDECFLYLGKRACPALPWHVPARDPKLCPEP